MSRFFKSAAFPILIVVVLAFLAVKLVNPGNKESYETGYVEQAAPELIKELRSAGVKYNVESEKSSAFWSLLGYILPFVIFLGFWIFLMNQVQGGGSKVMSFGKSRAKRLSADSPKITF